MSLCQLQQSLTSLSKLKVDVVVNDNRTTMISILERKRRYIRLSVHRMFLEASSNVINAIVNFINNQKDRRSSVLLQDYINTHLPLFGYDKKLNKQNLVTQGKVHDLKEIYDQVNSTYFSKNLKLNITWYGLPKKRSGSRMTYGLYHEPLKLIKIHNLLDQKSCPEFYVAFVIYHEMLHEVHRPTMGTLCTRIHTPEFKKQEKQFNFYHESIAWEKQYRHLFFK
ncbi:MAG: hypothetical protein S4CHLAM7_12030 [Chlamydiae bacterium]|nr:hypothetical protein [Chlamydiota bacterium]